MDDSFRAVVVCVLFPTTNIQGMMKGPDNFLSSPIGPCKADQKRGEISLNAFINNILWRLIIDP